MKSVRWLLSYIFVALLGLWLAFVVSAKFMAPAYSQNAPSNGELPAEFKAETEPPQVPSEVSPPAKPEKKSTQNTPWGNEVPAENVPAGKTAGPKNLDIPPPPGGEIPVGDGVTAAGSALDLIPQDEYKYDPTGKRDPFQVFRAIRIARPEGKTVETTDPLQRWELDRLQVVGILWDVRVPRAMIRDPDGALYTVTKNSRIGRNDGFVAVIREGEVVVIETKYDEGQAVKGTRVMELKK